MTDAAWIHDVDPDLNINMDPCSEFHAGIYDEAAEWYWDCDCNGDSVRDSCELEEQPGLDCNGNSVPDECDIVRGRSPDMNGNQVPDECEAAENIPALSEWGVAVMTVLVLTAGTLMLKRRRVA